MVCSFELATKLVSIAQSSLVWFDGIRGVLGWLFWLVRLGDQLNQVYTIFLRFRDHLNHLRPANHLRLVLFLPQTAAMLALNGIIIIMALIFIEQHFESSRRWFNWSLNVWSRFTCLSAHRQRRLTPSPGVDRHHTEGVLGVRQQIDHCARGLYHRGFREEPILVLCPDDVAGGTIHLTELHRDAVTFFGVSLVYEGNLRSWWDTIQKHIIFNIIIIAYIIFYNITNIIKYNNTY